ncbi:hypothetical protein SALBM311S_00508 [Streptomyces alboniger]
MARLPMYEVIYRDLDRQLSCGTLKAGDRLPSEGEMAEHYGVSRMTVRQAVGRLTDERRLLRRPGAGTFVWPAITPLTARSTPSDRSREDIGRGDAVIDTLVHVQQLLDAPEEVSDRLRLKPRQKVVRLLRVRVVDGLPAAIQDSWIPFGLRTRPGRRGVARRIPVPDAGRPVRYKAGLGRAGGVGSRGRRGSGGTASGRCGNPAHRDHPAHPQRGGRAPMSRTAGAGLNSRC